MCYDFCSAPSLSDASQRYCGKGGAYTEGNYLDCRMCKEAKYFKASYQLHQPVGKATQSIILLGPWNASANWGMEWIMNGADQVDPNIRKYSRVIDAVGRPASVNERNEPYGAWFGYGSYNQWYNNVPLPQEVDHAVSWVHQLIEQEHKIVGDYGRIVIIGKHQGANLAIESALRFP